MVLTLLCLFGTQEFHSHRANQSNLSPNKLPQNSVFEARPQCSMVSAHFMKMSQDFPLRCWNNNTKWHQGPLISDQQTNCEKLSADTSRDIELVDNQTRTVVPWLVKSCRTACPETRILYENSGQLQRAGAPVYCCQIKGKRKDARQQERAAIASNEAKMATDSRVGSWEHVAEHHQRVQASMSPADRIIMGLHSQLWLWLPRAVCAHACAKFQDQAPPKSLSTSLAYVVRACCKREKKTICQKF